MQVTSTTACIEKSIFQRIRILVPSFTNQLLIESMPNRREEKNFSTRDFLSNRETVKLQAIFGQTGPGHWCNTKRQRRVPPAGYRNRADNGRFIIGYSPRAVTSCRCCHFGGRQRKHKRALLPVKRESSVRCTAADASAAASWLLRAKFNQLRILFCCGSVCVADLPALDHFIACVL